MLKKLSEGPADGAVAGAAPNRLPADAAIIVAARAGPKRHTNAANSVAAGAAPKTLSANPADGSATVAGRRLASNAVRLGCFLREPVPLPVRSQQAFPGLRLVAHS